MNTTADQGDTLDKLLLALRRDVSDQSLYRQVWEEINTRGQLMPSVARFREALLPKVVGLAPPPTAHTRRRIAQTTLCAVDCLHPWLSIHALRQSAAGCEFDAVVLITDDAALLPELPDIEVIRVSPIQSAAAYSHFMIKELLHHVRTEYVLLVQWDGYVVDPQCWDDAFFLFDYVGARWPGVLVKGDPRHDVGNGGFSLRSRALLTALQDPKVPADHPEDETICRRARDYLEKKHGVAFAPGEVADRFSFEHCAVAAPTFGFHGVINMSQFLRWPEFREFRFLDAPTDPTEDQPRTDDVEGASNPPNTPETLEITIFDLLQIAYQAHESGRFDEARQIYQSILAREANNADAMHLLGLLEHQQGRSELASQLIDAAHRANPSNAIYLGNLAHVYRDSKRYPQANEAYRRLLKINPDNALAMHHLGLVLAAMRQFEAAEQQLKLSLSISPEAITWNDLGNIQLALAHLPEAASSYREAIALEPLFVSAHSNLGNVLRELGETEASVAACRDALAIDPSLFDAHHNLANALRDLTDVANAEQSYRAALALQPEDPAVNFNFGLLQLLQGNYTEGLQRFEYRLRGGNAQITRERLSIENSLGKSRAWERGTRLQGASLLLFCEQGLGDCIMMLRYVPLLQQRGIGKVTLYCRPELARLAATVGGIDAVIPTSQPLSANVFDLHASLMSLPYLFDTQLEGIPGTVPYLQLNDVDKNKWSDKLVRSNNLAVGFVWAGSKSLPVDAQRSIALAKLKPLLFIPNMDVFSLQKGDASKQVEKFNNIHDWMGECADLLDTAALIDQLDLVIAVDTAIAHLAGALGKPVYLLNRHSSEWRWLLGREDSPWYPSMKIFTQPQPGDWDSVITRVALELKDWSIRRANR